MADSSTKLSIITLHINNLKLPIKKQILTEWILNDPISTILKEFHIKNDNICRLKAKAWKEIYHAHVNFLKSRSSYINIRPRRLQNKEN